VLYELWLSKENKKPQFAVFADFGGVSSSDVAALEPGIGPGCGFGRRQHIPICISDTIDVP
jgi:hypothetical protein